MAVPQRDKLGLYISIPFCKSKCTYCNFASGVYPASEHERYIQRLVDEMRGARKWSANVGADLPRQIDTIYLGGGTPSLLEPQLIDQLFAAIRNEFCVDRDAEITVECAPGQLPDPTLAALLHGGVNRISFGVQSFIDREAQQSGRLHSRSVVLEDLRRLRSAGIFNINIDLIAGLAGQTFASWQESVAILTDTNVPHASIYMLEVDDESRLGRELLAGGARYHAGLVPNDDTVARMYEYAIESLGDAGLSHYEISNFGHEGFAALHNLRYWQRRPYLGLGLDASSMLYDSPGMSQHSGEVLRSTTSDDLKAYLAGAPPLEVAWLSAERRHEEAWFLGLRLNAGISISALRQEFGNQAVAGALEAVERLSASGLLRLHEDNVQLTRQGRLLSNLVFQEFLEIADQAPVTR